MSKSDSIYIEHIIDSGNKIITFLEDKTKEAFDSDEKLRLAVIHLLQIIGEAAGRISKEFCHKHPEIPWKAIIGMRNKVVHDYLGVDENIVWDTATNELPQLINKLEKLIKAQS